MKTILLSLLLAFATVSSAESTPPTPEELEVKLKKFLPDIVKIDEVNPTPFECLYEVIIGPTVFYSTAKGNYLITGEILNLGETTTSLTAQTYNKLRLQQIEEDGSEYMIYFGPKDNEKVITVFSSVDCVHCQKFHGEVKKLNAAGITVRYLAFPITPPGSEAYDIMAQVWNADDKAAAWEQALANKPLNSNISADDANLIPQIDLAHDLQLSGTPSIILNDGTITYGYLPAKVIIEEMP